MPPSRGAAQGSRARRERRRERCGDRPQHAARPRSRTRTCETAARARYCSALRVHYSSGVVLDRAANTDNNRLPSPTGDPQPSVTVHQPSLQRAPRLQHDGRLCEHNLTIVSPPGDARRRRRVAPPHRERARRGGENEPGLLARARARVTARAAPRSSAAARPRHPTTTAARAAPPAASRGAPSADPRSAQTSPRTEPTARAARGPIPRPGASSPPSDGATGRLMMMMATAQRARAGSRAPRAAHGARPRARALAREEEGRATRRRPLPPRRSAARGRRARRARSTRRAAAAAAPRARRP